MSDLKATVAWSKLLEEAVSTPGRIHQAYGAFWSYSVGNQMLAAFECAARSIPLGPIATFVRWKDLGRHVRKGEKAITLCMPVTFKTKAAEAGEGDAPETESIRTGFVFKPRWFVLAQTEGEEYKPEPVPGWDKAQALASLEITEQPFSHADGNCQGYASKRSIAVSPLAALPHKTRFHELAHVVLGHTTEGDMLDGDFTPRNVREVEAEAVALLCCESLGLAGAEFSRGYIQGWMRGAKIDDRMAQRIFGAADQILKAGRAQ